jgi:hypothetical protein
MLRKLQAKRSKLLLELEQSRQANDGLRDELEAAKKALEAERSLNKQTSTGPNTEVSE